MLFKKSKSSDPVFGSYLRAVIEVDPKDVIRALGKPTDEESEDGKVSKEWVFVDEKGKAYTIYDYKSTNLYDPVLPSPEEFWSEPIVELSIGSNASEEKVNEFLNWLRNKFSFKRIESKSFVLNQILEGEDIRKIFLDD